MDSVKEKCFCPVLLVCFLPCLDQVYKDSVYHGFRSIADEATAPLALMVGVVAAHALIYAAIGWEEGFQNPGLWRAVSA